jgi:hypothetical protein
MRELEVDWVNNKYILVDEDHIHADTSLVVTDENNNQTTNTYRYDENGRGCCTPELAFFASERGNMTCRIEGGETFLQAYNAERVGCGPTAPFMIRYTINPCRIIAAQN